MGRIGLLGGTFDPPHIGHLWLAEAARQVLQLERVLFLPAGQPPHKDDEPVSPAEQRREMTRLAIGGNPYFQLDETDLNRPAPHYTATLLPLLRRAYAGAQLWLITGSDSLASFDSWHQPQEVLAHCRLAVLPRPGYTVNWVTLSQAVPGLDAAVDYLDGPTMDISSTDLRRWASTGRSLRYLTPGPVVDYIREQSLYLSRPQPQNL